MTTPTFFRRSLLLPIVVPLVLVPFTGRSGVIGMVATGSLAALVAGGLPYVPFAVLLAVAMGDAHRKSVVKLALAAPLLFAVVEGVFTVAVAAFLSIGAAARLLAGIWMAGPLAACAVAFGYAYVLIALTLYAVLTVVGCIADEPEHRPRVVRWGPGDPRPARYAAASPRGISTDSSASISPPASAASATTSGRGTAHTP